MRKIVSNDLLRNKEIEIGVEGQILEVDERIIPAIIGLTEAKYDCKTLQPQYSGHHFFVRITWISSSAGTMLAGDVHRRQNKE